jgi:hypothetical protein
VAAHAGLLAGLILGLDRTDPPPEDPAFEVTLVPAFRPRTLERRPAPSPTPARIAERAPAARAPAPASTAGPVQARPAGTAPPAAGSADPAPENVRTALRQSSGCASAAYLRLTPADMARCEERNRAIRSRNTAVYPVISQEKKDFFDGVCKRDDDWCLYRTGQGPYPGLRSLFRKKH